MGGCYLDAMAEERLVQVMLVYQPIFQVAFADNRVTLPDSLFGFLGVFVLHGLCVSW